MNRKNKSRENQVKSTETQKKGLLKKLSLLWVIGVAVLAHFWIKKMGLDISTETPAIFILWVVSAMVAACFVGVNNGSQVIIFSKSECVLMPFENRYSDDSLEFFKKNGVISIATVMEVKEYWLGSFSTYYAIKYSFLDSSNQEHVVIKNCPFGIQIAPKVGDRVEIIYDKNHPEKSTIVLEKSDTVKWFRLQKKYKIKIIDN